MIRLEFANHNYGLIALLALGSVVATAYFYRKVLSSNWQSWLVVLPVLRLIAVGILLLVLADAAVVWSSSKPPIVKIIYDQSPTMNLKDIAGNGSANKQRLEWSSHTLTRALSGKSFKIDSITLDGEATADNKSDAFVFVTDGYSSPNIENLFRLAQSTNKPIYCALVPQEKLTPDVSIERVDAPRTFSVSVPAFVTVSVLGLNAQGSETLLTINDAAGVLASRKVKFTSNDQMQTIAIPVSESVAGLSNFHAKASLLNDEVNTANNEFNFSALIEERAVRILLFESQPSWEAKFFRRAFDDNTTVHVDYFAQVSRAATVAQPADSSSMSELHQILGNRERLFSYDAIVIGATDASFVSGTESRNLHDFVDIRGGGLVILGSNNYAGSIVTPTSSLAALLPSTIDAKTLVGERTVSTGVAPPSARAGNNSLALTSEGQRSPALSTLEDSDPAKSAIDKTAFGDSFLRVSGVHPTATVLAELRTSLKQVYPAIVAGDYGDGRVILLTPNDLYRISFATDTGQSYAAKLWQGLAYYSAARGKPSTYCQALSENGQNTEIELIVRDSEYKPTTVENISAILAGRGSAIPIFLRPDSTRVGRFTATIENSDNGPATLQVDGRAAKHPFKCEFLLNGRDTARPYRLNPDTKEKLSIMFGPENILSLDDAGALANRLESILPKAQSSESRYRLIDHYLPIFLVPLLLSLEFFLRRKWGIE